MYANLDGRFQYLDLARTYDATLHALYVVDRSAYASRPGGRGHELQQVLEQNRETVVEDVQSQAATDGVSVAAEITHGVPHLVISEYCDQQDIDLAIWGHTVGPVFHDGSLGA